MKAMGGRKRSLKELAEEYGVQGEYQSLFKEAQLGRQYRKELETDVVKLCKILDLGADYDVLKNIMKSAAAEDLMKLKIALEAKTAEVLPVTTQLMGNLEQQAQLESGFLI